jgi:tRNA (guanine37-N1)-methyltransferase
MTTRVTGNERRGRQLLLRFSGFLSAALTVMALITATRALAPVVAYIAPQRVRSHFMRRAFASGKCRSRRFSVLRSTVGTETRNENNITTPYHSPLPTSRYVYQSSRTLSSRNPALPLESTLMHSNANELTDVELKNLVAHWRDHPVLNPMVTFRSWVVPIKGKMIQAILNSKSLQPYLASRHELLQEMHVRLKIVRDYTDSTDGTEKLILLHPDTPPLSELPADVQQLLRNCQIHENGPVMPTKFTYKDFTASYILSQLLPIAVHPPPTAFETIGHVAHLNLKERHWPYRFLIGQVLLETLPLIESVINKVGEVSGPYRTYDFGLLAGRNDTRVKLTESGVQLQFDLADVYWCSRLSEERQRLLRTFQPGQIIADPFCGVGALCLLAASLPQRNCTIWANDWNPKAVEYLRENARRNHVSDRIERLQCGDAYDFLMDMGLQQHQKASTRSRKEDVTNKDGNHVTPTEPMRLPDHVVMNYPVEAPKFLGALRWWPVPPSSRRGSTTRDGGIGSVIVPRVHVYTFARADPTTDRDAEEVAVDLVAANLLPLGNTIHCRTEMNEDYDCDIQVHPVRDVAPGKVVLCVSFSATPKLLRYMQGDFR